MVRALDRLQVQFPATARPGSEPDQVVYTQAPLIQTSIVWRKTYKGGNAVLFTEVSVGLVSLLCYYPCLYYVYKVNSAFHPSGVGK